MKINIIISLLIMLGLSSIAFAQEEVQIDYGDNVIVDSDLDGLTDLGEEQKFKTDPIDPDSDGDGMFDGAEVLGGSDPLDPSSPYQTKVITQVHSYEEKETPWGWYVARTTGLLGFVLLWLSMIYGLAIRIPAINKLTAPVLAIDLHKWFSLYAILFALVHGVSLIFDKFLNFNLVDVFIPFAADFRPGLIAMGIIAFYLMVVLTVTSFLRKLIPFVVWRIIHHFNMVLYVLVLIHMVMLGTDMKIFAVRMIFVAMNIILLFILSLNIGSRIKSKLAAKSK